MKTQRNLFTTYDRLNMTKSSLNSTVKKRIGALAIATTLGLSTLSLSSCDLLNQFINPNNSSYNSNSTHPDENYSSSGHGTNNNSKYSQLLQNILNDNNLTGAYHPYDFLEDQGHDVDAIKRGDLTCKTSSYVKDSEPNNLYMMTYVETKAATPYYTEYVLKYNLTDQEMSDYEFLHRGKYIQAIYMNNEISENKRATVVNKAKISVKAHENFKEAIETDKDTFDKLNNKYLDIMLKEYSVADNTFSLYIFPRATMGNTMTYYGNIGTYPLSGSDSQVKDANGIMISPSDGAFGQSFKVNSIEDYDSFKKSIEPITLYNGVHTNELVKDLKDEID